MEEYSQWLGGILKYPQPFRWIISLKNSLIRYHTEHNSKNLSFSSIYSLINPFPPSISHILVLLPFPFAITNGCLAFTERCPHFPFTTFKAPSNSPAKPITACPRLHFLLQLNVSAVLHFAICFIYFVNLFHGSSVPISYTLNSPFHIVTIAPLPSHDEQP